MQLPRYSIIVPIYISKENENILEKYIVPCLNSIQMYTNTLNTEVILIVNGCTPKSTVVISNYIWSGFKVVFIKDGIGFAAAVNEGIKLAKGEFIVLFNDDCVLLKQPIDYWLKKLNEPFYDKTVGISGVHQLVCPITNIKFVVGYCVMLRKSMLDNIGIFDETFGLGIGEEIDLCGRAKKYGWKIIEVGKNDNANSEMVMGDFPIYHKGNVTLEYFNSQQLYEKNAKILIEKKQKGYY